MTHKQSTLLSEIFFLVPLMCRSIIQIASSWQNLRAQNSKIYIPSMQCTETWFKLVHIFLKNRPDEPVQNEMSHQLANAMR